MPPEAGSSSAQQQAVFCYRHLERPSPGGLRLSEPIACSVPSVRYRAQGPRERPVRVDRLDAEGQVEMEIRIEYRPDGTVAAEERVVRQRPENVQLYHQGQKLEFRPAAVREWEAVRIRTELDPAGNPIKVEKFVGERLTFVVERVFGPTGMVREVTRGQDGLVLLTRTFEIRAGKRFETMRDAQGRVSLEREAPPGALDPPEVELDTARPARIQRLP
jgi:hypothetical protein